MTDYQQHGIYAVVREDGDFHINAQRVTVGHEEKMEFFDFLTSAIFGDATPDEDQSDADALNDQVYREGSTPVIETGEFVATCKVEEATTAPVKPPFRGAGSSAEAWREYAAVITDSPATAWAALSRDEVIALLQEQGVLDAEPA